MSAQNTTSTCVARALLRQQCQPRDTLPTKQHLVLQEGNLIGPCDAMSRWHRFAFTIVDEAKVLKIARSSSGDKLVLSIDGLVRAEVAQTTLHS